MYREIFPAPSRHNKYSGERENKNAKMNETSILLVGYIELEAATA
jgi:hypothetical protein